MCKEKRIGISVIITVIKYFGAIGISLWGTMHSGRFEGLLGFFELCMIFSITEMLLRGNSFTAEIINDTLFGSSGMSVERKTLKNPHAYRLKCTSFGYDLAT